ncbi:hypothetical protein GBO31_00230 [Aquimarina litoralis]|nr:hypothetical protein [Aquimarina litoralis]
MSFGNFNSELSQLGKLYLPAGIFVLSIPIKNYLKELKIFVVLGVFFGVIISMGSIFMYIYKTGDFNFSSGKAINEVLILERVYIAFLCVISFVVSLDLFKHYRKLMLLNIAVLVVFVLLIAARMALISIVLIAFLYMIKKLDKRKVLIVLGLGTILLAGFFMTNKNLQNRFFYKDQDNSFMKNLAIWEPRMVIWPCVYDITKKENYNMINGLASYNLQEKELLDCYDRSIDHKEKREWFLFIKYNTHNQFLDFLLVSGILGLIIFVSFFVFAFWKNRHSFFSVSLILSFLLIGLVENYFHRQVGVYCFGVFLIFLMENRKKSIIN